MIKLLLTLIMMFTFGTSTVNAEEDTTGIKDRVSELAETKSDSQSIINAEVDELSEDELKTVIANVNELTEPTEDDLVIKEAAISKLEEMKRVEEYVTNADDDSIELTTDSNVETSNPLAVGIGVLGLILMAVALIMFFMGYRTQITSPLIIIGLVLIIVMNLLAK